MFGDRFFGKRYFATRYFGPLSGQIVPVAVSIIGATATMMDARGMLSTVINVLDGSATLKNVLGKSGRLN
jgi:hypothetical protein